VKTKLSLKQLVLAILALVSVLALTVIVLLNTTSSEVVTVSSAPPPAPAETANQSVSTAITESPESVSTRNSQAEVSGSASPTQAVAPVEETKRIADAKLIERPSSDDSRKASSSDAKSSAVRQEILRESKEPAIETRRLVRKAVKAVGETPNASAKPEPRETRPEPTRQSDVPVTVEKVETKTPAVTGGGERPRTVTRKPGQ